MTECLDDSPLQGTCCTNRCRHRGTCTLPRTPFLIYAVVSNSREKKNYIDAYINNIVYLKAGGKKGESDSTGELEKIHRYPLKPWKDPESLFNDEEFLKELTGKKPQEGTDG